MTNTVESSKEKNYITSLKILDTNKSKNKFVLSSIENKFNTENIKLLIQGNGFTGDAKKQIIISERFLKYYNLENKNIIGKNLTYELSYFNTNNRYQFLDDDNDSQNEFNFNDYENKNYDIKIFKNYKIVGVFNDKLLKYNDSEFIVSTNNLDFETFPIITNYSKGILFTYKNADVQNYSDEITKKGLIFPFMYGNTYRNFNSSASAISNKPLLIKEVQGDNFWELRKFYKWYDDKDFIYTMFFDNNMVSFIIYFDQILFIFIFLLVYGGIIFLSSILNYYNILDYNVNLRKRNMSLNKAIGFKNSDIKKLYFMEIGLIFFKALLIAVIIGALIIGLICIIIFAILQNHSTGILLGKYIKISLAMLPVAIVGLAVIMGILTWLFAYSQSKKLCKENIINHE